MDFPRKSLTNVHRIDGFAILHYQLFSIRAPNDSGVIATANVSASSAVPKATDDNLNIFYTAESKLRERGILVHVDVEEQEIWLFFPSSPDSWIKPAAGQEAEQYMLETCGVSLQWVFTNSIAASTLVEVPPAAAPTAVGTNASLIAVNGSNKQAWEANSSLGQPTEGKAPNSSTQPSMGDNEFVPVDIYELFISAVLAMFSYHLTRFHDYLPLSFRTFLSPAAGMSVSPNSSDFDESSEPRRRSTLVTLDVRLTDIGTLIVTSPIASSGISKLRPSFWDDNNWLEPAGTELRLSPGGQVAKCLGPAALGTDIMLAESAASFERPGVDVPNPETRLEDTWKVRVKDWLAGKGIYLHETTPRDWVKLITTSSRASTAENGIFSQKDRSDELQFLWPRQLCYTLVDAQSNSLDTGVDRLHFPDQDAGLHDPLSFAEDWFKSKSLRDDQLEAARSTQHIDELLAQQSRASETAILDNNSMDEPYIRVVNYLDLHAAGTIYPTPPDGTHNQGSMGAHTSNEIGSTPDNGDVGHFDRGASLGANNEHGLARSTQIGDGVYESGERRRSDASQTAMLSAGYDASNADMFGDMDGDMFGTSGITEADFSFFDEPDLEDTRDQIFDSMDPTRHADPSSRVGLASSSVPEGLAGDFATLTDSDPRSHDILSGPTYSISMETYEHNADDIAHKYPMNQEGPLAIEADVEPNQGTPVITNSAGEGTGDVEGNGFRSPPLSPVSVRKKLLPRLEGSLVTQVRPQLAVSDKGSRHCTNGASFQEGVFGRVTFARAVDFSDGKYGDDGRFSGKVQEEVAHQEARPRKSDIPSIGFPSSTRSHSQANDVDSVSNLSVHNDDTALDSDISSELDEGTTERVFRTQFSTPEDTDNKDLGEDASAVAGVKRKRDFSDCENAPVGEAPPQTPRQLHIDEGQAQIQFPPLSRFLPTASALPLKRSDPYTGKDMRKAVGLGDEDYIRVAQILTDQVVSSSLSSYGHLTTLKNDKPHSPTALAGKDEQAAIGEVIGSIFPTSSLCDLETYAAIEETTWESPSNVRALNKHPRWTKTNDGSGGLGSHIIRLNAPHIRVQRAETPLEVLSPALQFWETLGFAPVNGTKDVRAFCICPPMQGLEGAADLFLEGLGSAYESCKLGSHTRGDYPNKSNPGLIPIVRGEANASLESDMERIVAACEELGTFLGGTNAEDNNVVVYIINTFTEPDAVVHLCAAFLRLFHTYLQVEKSSLYSGPSEIVLQLIPVSFVASKTSIIVPTQAIYRGLALEVYERCGLGLGQSVDGAVAPGNAAPILLSHKIPASIDFKLTAEPPLSVRHETTDLHIAYSQSGDGRWISASWTDAEGSRQMSMSYCLGMKGASPRRAFAEIASEIWKTSVEMVHVKKLMWRFVIAKVGIMEPEEHDVWSMLADGSDQGSFTLVILAVDVCPSLSILPADLELTPNNLNTRAALYTTPISTPQPIILSPEQVITAATPASGTGPVNAPTPTENITDIDPDSSLIDVTDETWGVVLGHRIHNTMSLVERRPGLVSGYLIKRAGRRDEDGMVAMSVNLLHIDRPYTPQLRDILAVYRGLGTLARLKGLADPFKSVIPWHVAAAMKAQEVLSSIM